jgi:hypothetical protein
VVRWCEEVLSSWERYPLISETVSGEELLCNLASAGAAAGLQVRNASIRAVMRPSSFDDGVRR